MSTGTLGFRWDEVEEPVYAQIDNGADPKALLDELNAENADQRSIANMIDSSAAVRHQVNSGVERWKMVDNHRVESSRITPESWACCVPRWEKPRNPGLLSK